MGCREAWHRTGPVDRTVCVGSAVFGDDGECVVAIEGAGDGDEGVLWGDRECDDAGVYSGYEFVSVLGI